MTQSIDVAIIGGGPAGLAAALAAREAGASALILERDAELGGILNQCIHNGFGLHYFGEELTGPEYAHRFIERVRQSDIEVLAETFVLGLGRDLSIHGVSAEKGLVDIQAKAVVLAMGCRERTRGALSIPGTRPAGVYTAGCAQRLCNIEGYMPGKRVVVLGSGDIGMIMARRMAWEGAKVEMVCELMPYSSGLNRNIVQCLSDNDIPLLFNTTVVKVHGNERVEGVTIAQVDENRRPLKDTERFVACDTLLLSVGLIPENELSQDAGIELSAVTSGAVVGQNRETSVPGVFACGNVLHVHDLVDNVSEEAAIAGKAAAEHALRLAAASGAEHPVACGTGVRYTVPHRVRAGEGKVDVYFRVDAAYKPARLTVSCGDTVLLSRRKNIMTPGEMEKISLDLGKVTGDVTISVEGGAQ